MLVWKPLPFDYSSLTPGITSVNFVEFQLNVTFTCEWRVCVGWGGGGEGWGISLSDNLKLLHKFSSK